MMKKIIELFFIVMWINPVNATVIVDTGTTGSGTNWSLDASQWLAAEFSISNNETITDVEGYLTGVSTNKSLTAAIYSAGGDIPGSELFSSQFLVDNSINDWYGANSLNWSLNAGTYWLAFEVRSGDTYSSTFMGSAITPLNNEAFTSAGNYSGFDNLNLAVRISATSTSVPEPTSLTLLGLGLAGFGFSRKKKEEKSLNPLCLVGFRKQIRGQPA